MRKKYSVMLIAVLAMIICLTMAFGITAFAEGKEPESNPVASVENIPIADAPAVEAPVADAPAAAEPVVETTPTDVTPAAPETLDSETTPEDIPSETEESGQFPEQNEEQPDDETPTQLNDEVLMHPQTDEAAAEPAETRQEAETLAGEAPATEPAVIPAEVPVETTEFPSVPAPAEPIVEAEIQPTEFKGDTTGLDALPEGNMSFTLNYTITVSDANGKTVDVAGGSETVLADVLSALGYEIGEDTILEVAPESIDTDVVNVITDENGRLILTDYGPFSRAAKKMIVYVNGTAVELELIDPFEISGSMTAADVQSAFSAATDGNVKLTDDVALSDKGSITLPSGIHDLYLNGKTLSGKSGATSSMFIIGNGVTLNVYGGGDTSSDGEGKITSTSTIFEIRSGGTVNFLNGVTLNGKEPTRETITPPNGYTTDEHGLMAYRADAYQGYDFKGYVNDSWQKVTYANGGFTAKAYNAAGYTVTAVPSFVADGQAILMTYTIQSDVASPELRFFIAADTMIAEDDASDNSVDSDNVVTMTNDQKGVSLFGFSTTEGGIAVATEYYNSIVSYYDVIYGDDDTGIYADPSTVTPVDTADDSAFVLYFPVINFAAGDSKDYTFVIGMGDSETIDDIVAAVKAAVLNSKPDYQNETLIDLEPGIYEIESNGQIFEFPVGDGGSIPLKGTIGETEYDFIGQQIKVTRLPENPGEKPSETQTVNIAGRPDTPDSPGVPSEESKEKPQEIIEKPEQVESHTDKLTVFAPVLGQEYSIDGGETWQKFTGSETIEFTGLTPETEYSIITRIAATENRPHSEKSDEAKIKTIPMLKDITDVTVNDGSAPFDGNEHSIEIKFTGDAENVTISYSKDPNEAYSINKPAFTEIGEHTVYYRIEKPGCNTAYGSATVTIYGVVLNKSTGETETYGTIAEAIAHSSGGTEPDTITLMTDIPESVTVDEGKNIMLDLNGKTLTGSIVSKGTLVTGNGTAAGNITADENGKVEICDGVVNGTITANGNGEIGILDSSVDGDVTAGNGSAIEISESFINGDITANGEITIESAAVKGKLKEGSKGQLSIKDGYFSDNPDPFTADEYDGIVNTNLNPNYGPVRNEYGYMIGVAEAQIGNDKYDSLYSAIEDAENGETVKILDDDSYAEVYNDQNINLDLNGHSLRYLEVWNSSKVTVIDSSSEEKPGSIDYLYYDDPSDISIKGGIYRYDVSEHVGPGYQLVENTDEETKDYYPFKVIRIQTQPTPAPVVTEDAPKKAIVTTTDANAVAVVEVKGTIAQIVVVSKNRETVDPVNVTILEPAELITMGAKTAEIRMTDNFTVVLDIEAAMCGKANCVITIDNNDGVITVACDGVEICTADFIDIADSIAKLVYDGKTLKAFDAEGNLLREYEVR